MTARQSITAFLNQAAGGDPDAADRVWSVVYEELRRIAARELRREFDGGTLSTTGLVHEAYFKFADQEGMSWENRRHFYATACRAMRQILIDRARYRNAQKRAGAKHPVTLNSGVDAAPDRGPDLEALDEALTRLSEFQPRLGQVVECHFFGGLTFKETGEVLGTSERTAERDWRRARAYLRRLLDDEGPEGSPTGD